MEMEKSKFIKTDAVKIQPSHLIWKILRRFSYFDSHFDFHFDLISYQFRYLFRPDLFRSLHLLVSFLIVQNQKVDTVCLSRLVVL